MNKAQHHMHIFVLHLASSLLLGCFLAGCTSPTNLLENTRELAVREGFQERSFNTPSFDLLGFEKSGHPNDLHIYIEGDGRAWFRENIISEDPTPTESITLELAAADQSGARILYLARPCQFLKHRGCAPDDWTFGRFSKRAIESYLFVLDALKHQNPGLRFHLYGYSGGAMVTLFISSMRNDIAHLTTFAGLLDHDAWTRFHKYSPLSRSLPSSMTHKTLSILPQTHFLGRSDREIPPHLSEEILRRLSAHQNAHIVYVDDMTHTGNWASYWRTASENQPLPKI